MKDYRIAYLTRFIANYDIECGQQNCRRASCQPKSCEGELWEFERDILARNRTDFEINYHFALAYRNKDLLNLLFERPKNLPQTAKYLFCDDKLANWNDKSFIVIKYQTELFAHVNTIPPNSANDIRHGLNATLLFNLLVDLKCGWRQEEPFPLESWRERLQAMIGWTSNWHFIFDWYQSVNKLFPKVELHNMIRMLEFLLSESLNPAGKFHFPETAHHYFCYVLGSLHEELGNIETAKNVFSNIPYDAELPAEALSNIGALLLTGPFRKNLDEKVEIQVDAKDAKAKDEKIVPLKSAADEAAQQFAARRALPFLLSAVQRDETDNGNIQTLALSTLRIVQHRGNESICVAEDTKKEMCSEEVKALSRSCHVIIQIKPLHDTVTDWLQKEEKRLKSKTTSAEKPESEELKGLQAAQKSIQTVYEQCEQGVIKTSQYRTEVLKTIQDWKSSEAVTKHARPVATYLLRSLGNFFIALTLGLGYFALRKQIDKTHVSDKGYKTIFFSFSTDRKVQSKKLVKELEKHPVHQELFHVSKSLKAGA